MKKLLLILSTPLIFIGCNSEYEGLTAEEWFNEYDTAIAEAEDLSYQLDDLQSEYDGLRYEYDDLESEYEDVMDCLNWAYDYEDYEDCADY